MLDQINYQIYPYHINKIINYEKGKVMFGNSFYFLFSKTCFWKYKEKTIFLYFWNQNMFG